MDDNVGIDHQRVDGRAVQNVALPIDGLRPAVGGGVKRPPRHPDDALHSRITLQRLHDRDPDLTRRPGDRDCERHPISVRLLGARYSQTVLSGFFGLHSADLADRGGQGRSGEHGNVAGQDRIKFNTPIDAGLEPAARTDMTGIYLGNINPFTAMQAAVTRQADDGLFEPQEAVSVEDAQRMWTIWAAKALDEGQHRGTIEVGKLADMVVLTEEADDPTSPHPPDLGGTEGGQRRPYWPDGSTASGPKSRADRM